MGDPTPLVSQSVSRKLRFSGFAAGMHVVVRGRDVLVAKQVADADEVAGAFDELGSETVTGSMT